MGGGAIFGDRAAGDIEKERRRLTVVSFIGLYFSFSALKGGIDVWVV